MLFKCQVFPVSVSNFISYTVNEVFNLVFRHMYAIINAQFLILSVKRVNLQIVVKVVVFSAVAP